MDEENKVVRANMQKQDFFIESPVKVLGQDIAGIVVSLLATEKTIIYGVLSQDDAGTYFEWYRADELLSLDPNDQQKDG